MLSGVSLRIGPGCHMSQGAGVSGMCDAYQVLMADTQRGRPPVPASRVCVCVEVTEARYW